MTESSYTAKDIQVLEGLELAVSFDRQDVVVDHVVDDRGEALERLPGYQGRPTDVRRPDRGRPRSSSGGAGADGLGERLAPPDRAGPKARRRDAL